MPRTQVDLCARCGREVPAGEILCASCREEEPAQVIGKTTVPAPSEAEERARRWPPSMVRPSPVQYHATVMVTVFLVLAGLALFAFLHHRGIGPFDATVGNYRMRGSTVLVVDMTVRNDGSKTARANCVLSAYDAAGTVAGSSSLLTQSIEPGHSISLHETVRNVAGTPVRVTARCT